jgi:drug/metabolite transporter (DMT)-like permease
VTLSYDWLALGAACCWAVTSLLSAPQARHLGAFAFTRWRMGLVLLLLLPVVGLSGGWQTLTWQNVGVLMVSGLIGIFIGDTALFACMNRMGPRAMVGGALVVGGVMTAVAFGARKDESHELEAIRGHWVWGVALGLLAALCQALGSLVAKPVMVTGVDPVAATLVRVFATTIAHLLLLWAGVRVAYTRNPMTAPVLGWVALSGLVGMGLGMSLILLALQRGNVGMVGILSSVSPVLVLPLLWWYLGRSPARGAWAGAALTVAGTVLVLVRQSP